MKYVSNTLLLLSALFSPLGFTEVVLRFQPEIDANARVLGDIVQIDNDEHHWADLPLQSHPNPGERISSYKILDWMKPHWGDIKVIWQGKKQITVRQTLVTMEKALCDKAKSALIKELGDDYARVNIEPLSAIKGSEYPIESFKTEINRTFPPAKRLCVWLIHEKQRIAVWFKVSVYTDVWVANNPLVANTLIGTKSFSRQQRNIAGLQGSPLKIIPKEAWLKHSIEPGTILLEQNIKKAPLIIKGESVSVNVKNQGVTVTMVVLALENGHLGQTIRVKNPLSQKTFTVLVNGAHQAVLTA